MNVKGAAEGRAKTVIRYDHEKGELVFDASAAGADKSLDPWNPPGARGEPHQDVECAPFRLSDGEELNLRVFIDGDIVEVFANDRQAISRRVFSPPQNKSISLCGRPTEVKAYTVAIAAAVCAGGGLDMENPNIDEFRKARFGLFLHWGLYSQLGGRWKGEVMKCIGEWTQSKFRIPNAEFPLEPGEYTIKLVTLSAGTSAPVHTLTALEIAICHQDH